MARNLTVNGPTQGAPEEQVVNRNSLAWRVASGLADRGQMTKSTLHVHVPNKSGQLVPEAFTGVTTFESGIEKVYQHIRGVPANILKKLSSQYPAPALA